jgi:hypothetical protein
MGCLKLKSYISSPDPNGTNSNGLVNSSPSTTKNPIFVSPITVEFGAIWFTPWFGLCV